MKNNIYAEIKDKKGAIVYVGNYGSSFEESTLELFREGYPKSFDEYDLEFIGDFLGEWDENQRDKGCLLAIIDGEMVGACLFEKVAGAQDQWETPFLFTKGTFRKRGIGRILVGAQEEFLKEKIRLLIVKTPDILPEEVVSYPFWLAVGFEHLFTWLRYYRDDVGAIVLQKRNPHYPIGQGIPENSAWEPGTADSLTGKRMSKKEYQGRLRYTRLTPKEKWGLGLVGRENIISWKQ